MENPTVTYFPGEPMPRQTADWTCSACSLAWMNRSLHIDHAETEWRAVDYIGDPRNINSTYGLMDASGARLAECLREDGAPSHTSWPSWETVLVLAANGPLLIGGVTWNHWVGVRGTDRETLSLANSAPGWRGIDDTLDAGDWDTLGPFAVVAVQIDYFWPAQIGRGLPSID